MQGRNYIVIGAAIFIGLLAVFLGNAYFSGFEKKQEAIAEEQKLARIVVASQDMAFGTAMSASNLRLANWPSQSIPAGAFTSIEALTAAKRVALRPIVVGEPILASKISGSGGRAILSANLPVGKLAYTIPVNDVSGLAGFVRPGDLVNVILTRPIPGDGAGANDKMTDVIVEAAPVLGMDQVADANDTKATPAKTATLEVDSVQAQKLALSIQLGQLSLALRNIADESKAAAPTILPRHLSASAIYMPRRMGGSPAPAMVAPVRKPRPAVQTAHRKPGPMMTVVRGSAPSEYEVPHGY